MNKFNAMATARAHMNKGIDYAEEGNYSMAIVELNKSLKIYPEYDIAYHNIGLVYSNSGDKKLSIEYFTKAIKLNPLNSKVYYDRGNSFFYNGEYDKAVFDYSCAINYSPDYVNAYVNRGLSHYKNGNIDLAIDDYTKAISINQNCLEAYKKRAKLYIEKGETVLAEIDCQKIISMDKNIKCLLLVFNYTNELDKSNFVNQYSMINGISKDVIIFPINTSEDTISKIINDINIYGHNAYTNNFLEGKEGIKHGSAWAIIASFINSSKIDISNKDISINKHELQSKKYITIII